MSLKRMNRREVLSFGAALASAAAASTQLGATPDESSKPEWARTIENIINAKGDFSNGVLSIDLDRDDIGTIMLNPPIPGSMSVPVKPAFQVNGTLTFQQIAGRVMSNSDMALKPSEIDPFISALIRHEIIFQAEHQHFYDFSPMVWFVHFRQMGSPEQVAENIKAALNVTSTPFPQAPPPNPHTPLPVQDIAAIIGVPAKIDDDGVVHFSVPRANPIFLGGVQISPFLNVQTMIDFEPLNANGTLAAAVPDFGMVASEINPVVGLMRSFEWDSGCLYNQETDEQPQLYFDHFFKAGNPIDLARQIRAALNLMNVAVAGRVR